MRAPRHPGVLTDLHGLLVSPEPLQAFAHRRVTDWQAGQLERVHHQTGAVTVRFRERCGIRRSGRPKRPGLLAPPPSTERFQSPSSIVTLLALNLCDQGYALRAGQQVIQTGRGQQQPSAIEETLCGVRLLQILAQLLDACLRLGGEADRRAWRGSDSQRSQSGAKVCAVDGLERFKPEVEPVPRPVRTLCLPQLLEG